jgi:hypothetical protein
MPNVDSFLGGARRISAAGSDATPAFEEKQPQVLQETGVKADNAVRRERGNNGAERPPADPWLFRMLISKLELPGRIESR